MQLWHASPVQFDRPDCDKRVDNGHHANSGLGLYTATQPASYIAGFGYYIYELTLSPTARVMNMTVRELYELGAVDPDAGRAFFESERLRLLPDWDAIAIIESDGSAQQMIVLNTDLITDCHILSPEEFGASSLPKDT